MGWCMQGRFRFARVTASTNQDCGWGAHHRRRVLSPGLELGVALCRCLRRLPAVVRPPQGAVQLHAPARGGSGQRRGRQWHCHGSAQRGCPRCDARRCARRPALC